MDILTNIIRIISPMSAVKRLYAQQTLENLRTYDAAKANRFNKNKKITDGNANQELVGTGDIAKLRKNIRYLFMNSPIARSAVRASTATIVGKNIIIQAKATDKNGKPLEEFNKSVNRYFKIWSKRCDIRGKKSFSQFLRQAADSYIIAGEYFLQKLYRDDPICSLRIGSIEPDNVDHTINTDKIIGGIEFDADYKPIKYYLTTQDISTKKATVKQSIDASNVIHSYLEDRPGQVRGEPWLAPGVDTLWSIDRAFKAELSSIEVQACLSVVYKSGTGGIGGRSAIMGQGGSAIQDSVNGVTQRLAPATIIGIPNADDIKIIDPARPGGNFTMFVDKGIEIVASCINMSYSKVNKDYSKGNFSSQRMGEQDVRRQTGIVQTLLDDDIVTNVWEAFIRELVIKGLVKAPNFEEDKDFYLQKEVSFQPFEYIQPLQDAQADAIKFRSKIFRMDEILDGQDPYEHIDDIAKMNDYANKKGISLYPDDQRVVNVGGAILDVAGEKNEVVL